MTQYKSLILQNCQLEKKFVINFTLKQKFLTIKTCDKTFLNNIERLKKLKKVKKAKKLNSKTFRH